MTGSSGQSRRNTRVVAVAAALLAPVLALAACAPVGDPSWAPPTWEDTAVHFTDPPPPLDAAAMPELTSTLVAQRVRNDDVGAQARYSLLPGNGAAVAAFNDAVERVVRDAVAAQAAASGIAYAPAVHATGAGLADRGCVDGSTSLTAADLLADPRFGPAGGDGVAVVCEIVAAGGPILAERVRVVTGTGGTVASDTVRTFYVDTATGEVADPAALWSADAATALSADVVTALRRDAGALSLAPASPGDEAQLAHVTAALATTLPGADGGFVFTIPPGLAAPGLADLGATATTEPLTVAVPAAVAEPMLSPLGARVLATAAEPYAGPAAVPAGLQRVDCSFVPCVALTYDDGPSGLTNQLLDDLAAARAAATFYMLGASAAGNGDIVRRVAAEGHEIGNHTWSHPSLPSLDDAAIASQLTRTRDVLRSLSGQRVASFRPPYGEFDARVLAVAGQPAILWTVDTRDWAGPPDDALLASAIDDSRPGGIVLFHDVHERTIRVAPSVFAGLQDRGFTLVTVSQLFGGSLPGGGAWRGAG